MTRNPLTWAAAISLLAVAGCCCLLLLSVRATLAVLPGELLAEVHSTRTDLNGQVETGRKAVVELADQQMSGLRADALGIARQSLQTADRRIGDTLARADRALDSVEGLRKGFEPVLAHAGSVASQVDGAAPLFLDCEFNADCLFNRYQGASKGFERTLQDVSAMTHDFRGAVPPTLAGWNRIVANSDATSEATAAFMGHLAVATKPLPTWARIGLAVAPPLVQTGFTVGSWLALKGR